MSPNWTAGLVGPSYNGCFDPYGQRCRTQSRDVRQQKKCLAKKSVCRQTTALICTYTFPGDSGSKMHICRRIYQRMSSKFCSRFVELARLTKAPNMRAPRQPICVGNIHISVRSRGFSRNLTRFVCKGAGIRRADKLGQRDWAFLSCRVRRRDAYTTWDIFHPDTRVTATGWQLRSVTRDTWHGAVCSITEHERTYNAFLTSSLNVSSLHIGIQMKPRNYDKLVRFLKPPLISLEWRKVLAGS